MDLNLQEHFTWVLEKRSPGESVRLAGDHQSVLILGIKFGHIIEPKACKTADRVLVSCTVINFYFVAAVLYFQRRTFLTVFCLRMSEDYGFTVRHLILWHEPCPYGKFNFVLQSEKTVPALYPHSGHFKSRSTRLSASLRDSSAFRRVSPLTR